LEGKKRGGKGEKRERREEGKERRGKGEKRERREEGKERRGKGEERQGEKLETRCGEMEIRGKYH